METPILTPATARPAVERPVLQAAPLSAHDPEIIAHATVNWRAIFAGTAIALLAYLIFASLGLAVGGPNIDDVIRGRDSAKGLGIGAAVWLVASTLISLFLGAFGAGRVSGLVPTRVGRTQGVVIAALFFGFLLSQLGATIGSLGRGVGDVVGFAGSQAGQVASTPQGQQVIRNALGGLNLQSPPEVVARNLATRLLRGDTRGARDYLAAQAGITPAEADRRLQSFRQDAQSSLQQAGETASRVTTIAGWSLFGTLLLGMLAAALGGGLGAGMSLARPLDRSDRRAIEEEIRTDRAA